jgi:peptide/nickel transport system substrate-binding protein
MRTETVVLVALPFLMLTGACGPAPARDAAGAPSSAPGARPTRTAVFLTHVEPPSLSEHRVVYQTGGNPSDAKRLFNASLFLNDPQGVSRPTLADRKPELNTDSWRVLPDGRMETVYRLRPGLTWHDGAPFTTDDMVLSFRVLKTPDFGVDDMVPVKWMDEAVAIDGRTVLVRWNTTYPMADALSARDWAPLPAHILKTTFENQDAQAFLNLPFWTSEFVGLGPFRVERREPGAFIEGVAFDGYAQGRPRIDRVRVRFASDANTALSNLLAGDVHMAIDGTLGFEQGTFLKREWAPQNRGTILLTANNLRYVQIQFKPGVVSPLEILDPRVRRALSYAIDKQALLDGVQSGEGQYAEGMYPPLVEYFDAAERAVVRYPYDPRQTERLLMEAGFARNSAGLFSKGGEVFRPELRASAADTTAREQAILADRWRQAGVDVQSRLLSEAEQNDREVRSLYPAFATADSVGLEERTIHAKMYGPNIAALANRWAGPNRGGWQDARFDQLYDQMNTDLDRAARNSAIVEMVRILSEQLPVYPLYYNYDVRAFTSALRGPQPYAPGAAPTWGVEKWEIS